MKSVILVLAFFCSCTVAKAQELNITSAGMVQRSGGAVLPINGILVAVPLQRWVATGTLTYDKGCKQVTVSSPALRMGRYGVVVDKKGKLNVIAPGKNGKPKNFPLLISAEQPCVSN